MSSKHAWHLVEFEAVILCQKDAGKHYAVGMSFSGYVGRARKRFNSLAKDQKQVFIDAAIALLDAGSHA